MNRKLFAFLSVAILIIIAISGCSGNTGKIRIATDATWPPFEMVDEQSKEIIGLDIDLMKAIAENQGLEIEFVNVNFDSLLAGIAQCQYDAAISAISITDERKESMLFSDSYFLAGQIITISKDNMEITSLADLDGKKVGAQLGTTGEIEAQAIPNVDYRSYDSVDLAFLDVMNGQIDAVIADNPLAYGYVNQNPDKIKTVGDVFTGEDYGIAVCNKNAELLEKINKGLAAVKAEGLIDELITKWLSAE